MSPQELAALEAQHLSTGPFASLSTALQTGSKVLVSCRNNKKLLARVKAFDRHFNMILEEVREIWTDPIRKRKNKPSITPCNKDRYISKMFLRGDSVVLVVLAPPPAQ